MSTEPGQSQTGTDTVNAILNAHLATGRIGLVGSGPFSLTGQPNAMGGREAGGMANTLAAHMGFSPPERDRVRRFWDAPNLVEGEGMKAVALFDAIERGDVRALWVLGTNPAVSLPKADRVRAALGRLDLLVVSENVLSNDTVAAATAASAGVRVLLPAAAWGEKDGAVTNSERRISRQRAFLPLPGEARPDWWALAAVATRLGFGDAFAWDGPAAIFREHAALSGFENAGTRDFDIGALAGLTGAAYEAFPPTLWPARADAPSPRRLFAEGRFFTPDGRARFVAPAPPTTPALDDAFPLRLNTGRVRDQWHTMTRTGRSPRLGSHTPAPFVAVHPDDAARFDLEDGGLARVATAYGATVLEVSVTTGQAPGALFAPIHWSDATASNARVGALVQPLVDPFSGQPDSKATSAAIEAVPARSRGFTLSRTALDLAGHGDVLPWWCRVALDEGAGALFATDVELRHVAERVPALFPYAELAEYVDSRAGLYRCVASLDGRLVGCLFLGPAAARPQWDAVRLLFQDGAEASRSAALSGRGRDGSGGTAGPLVCSCFGVGLAAISDAVRDRGATSPELIGAALRAGTNCGSCVPELKRIIARELAPTAG